MNIVKIIREKTGEEPESVYIYVMPFEVANFNAEVLSKRTGKSVKVFIVNDKNKYDPENKAGKAKPGRPAIYIE